MEIIFIISIVSFLATISYQTKTMGQISKENHIDKELLTMLVRGILSKNTDEFNQLERDKMYLEKAPEKENNVLEDVLEKIKNKTMGNVQSPSLEEYINPQENGNNK